MTLPNKPSAEWINGLSEQERAGVLGSEFGKRMWFWGASHVGYIHWATPAAEGGIKISSGSMCFLDCGRGLLAITAGHVYREYEATKRQFPRTRCRIGNIDFDPEAAFLCCRWDRENRRAPDIATFSFTYDQLKTIGRHAMMVPKPSDWPPRIPKHNQTAFVGGFPGRGRIWLGPREVSFGLCAAMTAITNVSDYQITCRSERDGLVDVTGKGLPPVGFEYGGISGGPLLVPWWRDDAWEWQLCGILSEAPTVTDDYDMFTAVRADFINPDGSIGRL